MTCEKCVHYEVCEALEANDIPKIHPKLCGFYKDKALFVELPCTADEVKQMPKPNLRSRFALWMRPNKNCSKCCLWCRYFSFCREEVVGSGYS